MLTDTDKGRIREEELYRYEVRKELTPTLNPRQSSPAIRFLGSPLGLWLLSAVFITGIGGAWSKYLERQSDSRTTTLKIDRLDSEISYRYSQVLQRLFTIAHDRKDSILSTSEVVALLERPSEHLPPLHPEFRDRHVSGLVAELRLLLPSGPERDELDKLLGHLTTASPLKLIEDDPTKSAAGILASVVLPRWKRFSFYHVKCPPSEPFCT
jgi:hypothetical protein